MKPNYIGHETAWHLPSRYLTDDRARGGMISNQHIEPSPCRKQWQPDKDTWLPKKAHAATVLTRKPLLDELGVPGVQDGVESLISGQPNSWSSVMCRLAPPERDNDATLLNDLPAPVGSESSFEDEEEERSPLAEFNKRSKRWHRYVRHQRTRADGIMRGVDMGNNCAPTPMSEVVERTDQYAVAQLIAYLQTTLSSDDEGELRISAGQVGSNLAGVQDVVGEVGDYLTTSSEEENHDYPQISVALGLTQERRELTIKKRRTAEKKNWKFLKNVVGSVGATTKRRKQPVISLETPKDRERKAAVKKRKIKDQKLRDEYDFDSDSQDHYEGIASTEDPRSVSPLSVVSSKSHSAARSNASGAVPYRRTKIARFTSTPAPLTPKLNDSGIPAGTAQQIVAAFKVSNDVEVRVVREEGSDLVFILEAMNHSSDSKTITINMDILGDTFDIMTVFVPVSNSPIVAITVEGGATLTILRMKLNGHDICMPDDMLRSMGAAIREGGTAPSTRGTAPYKQPGLSKPPAIGNDNEDTPAVEADGAGGPKRHPWPSGIHPAMIATANNGTRGDVEADTLSPKRSKGSPRTNGTSSSSPRLGRGKTQSTRGSSTAGKSPQKGDSRSTRITATTISHPRASGGQSSNINGRFTSKENPTKIHLPTGTTSLGDPHGSLSDRGPSPLEHSNDTLPPHSRSRSPVDPLHFQPTPLPWRRGFQSQSDVGAPSDSNPAVSVYHEPYVEGNASGSETSLSTPSRTPSNADSIHALNSGSQDANRTRSLKASPNYKQTNPLNAKGEGTFHEVAGAGDGHGRSNDQTMHGPQEYQSDGGSGHPIAPLVNARGNGDRASVHFSDATTTSLAPSQYPEGGGTTATHPVSIDFQPEGDWSPKESSDGVFRNVPAGEIGALDNGASNSFRLDFGNMDAGRRQQQRGQAYVKPTQPPGKSGGNVTTPQSRSTPYNAHPPDHRVHPNSRQHMGGANGRSQKGPLSGRGDTTDHNNELGKARTQPVRHQPAPPHPNEVASNQMKQIILRSNASTIPRIQTTPLEQIRPQSSVEKYLRSGASTPRSQKKNMLLTALLEIADDREDTGVKDGIDNTDLIEQIVDYMIGAPDSEEAIEALLAATAESNVESVAKAVAQFLATNDGDGHIMQLLRKKDPGLYLEVAEDIASVIGGGPQQSKKPQMESSQIQRRSIRYPAHTGSKGPYISKGLSFKVFKGMMDTYVASSPSPRRGPQTAQTLLLENQRLEAVVNRFMAAIKCRVMHPHPMSVAFSKMVVAIGTRLRHLQRVNLEKLICIMHRKMGDKGWFPPYSDEAVVDGGPINNGRPLGKSSYTFQQLVRPGRLVGWTFAEDPNNAPLEEADVVTLDDLEAWIESHRGPHLCPIPPVPNPDATPRSSLSARDRRRALSCRFV